MRTFAALIFVLACSAGCGGAAPQHYNVTALGARVRPAIDACLKQNER
ncbi:MAG: hypothetical protein WAU41_14470 [Gaiellaceae bacterium]